MNIVEQVVSLELSKKLAEAGYPQEGYWWWNQHFRDFREDNDYAILERDNKAYDYVRICAAPTVSELMEQLPVTIPTEKHLQITKWDNATGGHFFAVDYGIVDHNGFSDVSLANACAKMWLWLMEVEGEDLR